MAVSSSVADVWDVIGAVSGVDQWLNPMIEACRVDGDKRYCTAQGAEFEEDILEVNHTTRTFRYGIPQQHLMPAANILGTMHVRAGDGSSAIVDWGWTFDVEADKEEEVKGMLAQVGEMGVNGIDAYIKNGKASVA